MKLKFWKKINKDEQIKELKEDIDLLLIERQHRMTLIILKTDINKELKTHNNLLREALIEERGQNE